MVDGVWDIGQDVGVLREDCPWCMDAKYRQEYDQDCAADHAECSAVEATRV